MVVSGGQVIRSQSKIRGRDRKGIRARDLLVQATDPTAKVMEASPEFDEPKVMLETMRIEGADCLTAQDTALHKFMLAHARNVDIEAEWHVIGVDAMSKFLNVDGDRGVRLSRIRESVKRIDHTRVSYDFRSATTRIDGDIPLLLAQFEQDLRTGTAQVRYSIPKPVRAAILEAAAYVMLQLNAFPKFTCRYTGRLYPRLAYYSSKSGKTGKRWEIEPSRLAEALSYPIGEDGELHLGSFMRRCVEPALADIAQHVETFKVKMDEPIRGAGRGRPVEKLVFLISPTKKSQETTQAARLSSRELTVVGLADESLAPHELPSTLVVGRGVTSTGIDATTLSEGWRSAYERAKANPKGEVMPGLEAWLLISVVERSGVGAGFAMWSEAAAELHSVPTHRLRTAPVAIGPAAAAPAATEVPDHGMSVGLLAMVRKRPTEEGRLARAKELAQGGAQDILDALRGFYPGTQFKASFDADHFAVYCDSQVSPWDSLEKHVNGYGSLVAALRILRRTEDEQRRKSLRNLAYAVKEWDMSKILRIAGAIVAADKAGNMPAPPPRPSRPRTARGFTPTRQVSEASAEYDFTDPAYAAGAMPWDDRDAADLDSDQCPF